MSYGWLQNPYEADRNIHGRWGRVFLGGEWMAQATEVSYSVEIEKGEVRRSGTRWNDNKSGSFTGTGTLTYDKVNSFLEALIIAHLNGVDPAGATAAGGTNVSPRAARRTLPVFEVQVVLEDPAQPGATWNQDGSMATGQETVTLHNVKFWNLEGGYGTDQISRSVELTFSGITLDTMIVDPPSPQI